MSRSSTQRRTEAPGATKPKVCATCGRTIEWRKKWARDWAQVRFCSERCRRHKPGPLDAQLETAVLDLLAERRAGASICPSEVARAVRPADWRDHMERTREAARRLVARGEVQIVQRGQVVDPSTARGPIRIRKVE